MKKANRYDNKEMKVYILSRLAEVEFTHDYAIGIRGNGMVEIAFLENADEIMNTITYCEKQASSHGGVWGVRMWNSQECFSIIRDYAMRVVPICSIEEFEASFAKAREKGFKGNRGDWLEKCFVQYIGGTLQTKRNAKCTECGDVVLNGRHWQIKLWNATITTEPQVNRFYTEMIAKED